MQRVLPAFFVVLLILGASFGDAQEPRKDTSAPVTFGPNDWPWWRGPSRNGVADPAQKPPLRWSESENILWKTPIPGRGHGSPIVVGDQVIVATAEMDREVQSVLCFDRQTGKQLWVTEVHHGGLEKKGNAKASQASATAACDGERIYINFLNRNAIFLTALSRTGKQLWQHKVADYVLHQGFGSSPTVYESLVLVTADNKGTGVIAAYDRVTGKLVWQQPRPQFPNYASPIIFNVAGRDQLLLTGCELVSSFDPRSGKKLWEFPGSTTETVTSTVTDGQHMFISGGYPKGHVAAVRVDGSGKVAWEINTKVYVPSMLVHKSHLYAVTDQGAVLCLKCDTGKEAWKARIEGQFTASPVLVGDHIYATSEAGRTFIFEATPEAFTMIGETQLSGEVLATPTICGSRIYLRIGARQDGRRQEMLYCLGQSK